MFSQLKPIGEMRYACPDDAKGLTANQVSRFNARARPLIVRPRKLAKDYIQTPIYDLAEAQIFNFISQVAPAGERDGATDALSAAWAAIYMADVAIQGKRPQNWMRAARSTVERCLTYLLTRQAGSATGVGLLPTYASSDPRYGGLATGTPTGDEFSTATWSTELTIAAGIAFVKAYAAFGTAGYLQAADRAAWFIRRVQSGNVQVGAYTVLPSGGGRYYVKGLASGMVDSTATLTANYYLADVLGLLLLRLLADVKGDGALYGDATATAYFGANQATLATMIDDLTSFAVDGARDANSGGALVPGLSTSPKTLYQAATNGVGGNAAWQAISEVTTRDLALALLGVYSANGNTATVSTMMAWLASFSSNEDNRTPATLPEDQLLAGITGTYDPALCPADNLTPAELTEADGALYDWASFGVLSPILASNQGQMRTSKDTLSSSVRFSFYDVGNVFLGPIGSSGLTLQPFFRNADGALVGVSGAPATGAGAATATPPSTGLVFWVRGDRGLQSSGGLLTAWRDQGPFHQDLDTTDGNAPSVTGVTVNGVPAVTFPLGNNTKYIRATATMKDRDGNAFTAATPRTVLAMIVPRTGNVGGINRTGGPVFSFREQPCFECLFSLESFFHVNGFYWFDNAWPFSGGQLLGPDAAAVVYAAKPTLAMWQGKATTGAAVLAAVNNVSVALTPSTSAGVAGAPGPAGFVLGNADNNTGTTQSNFQGDIAEVLVYDYVLTGAALAQAAGYMASRYSSAPISVSGLTSVIRAARTGMVYRQAPGRYPLLRGN